jgi:hypothetical protein
MKDMPVFNLESLNLTVGGKKLSFLSSTKGYRAKVPGGWLVFIWDSTGMNGVTFYPDSDHGWDGGTENSKAAE